MGFYSLSVISESKKPTILIPQCGACGLYKKCLTPKMKVYGEGKKGILIVGEFPSAEDDTKGTPFAGKTGQFLRSMIRRYGIDPNSDCWLTNALICKGGSNLKATAYEQCRPNIINTIRMCNPKVIILLGTGAVRSVIGWILAKEDTGPINNWTGWKIPDQKTNAWICPTYSVSTVYQMRDQVVLAREFDNHIERALAIKKRPYQEVPNYVKEVEIIRNSKQAASAIQEFTDSPKATAFDFETDRIKPDRIESKLVCCSLSNGKRTITYPFYGEATDATRKFLKSSTPKIGYNLKFEDRWVRSKLGYVRNWVWDGMIASHVLDNRKGINSLKFQAYVHLGQATYDENIKPFLASKEPGANAPNRIDQIQLDELLLYCGLDALLEYKIAKLQKGLFQ